MLEFDEYDQILVTNLFADDGSTVSSSNNHDAFITHRLNSSSEHHPLRSPSVSPARRCNMPSIPSVTVIDSEGEMQPRLTSLLSSDGLSVEVAAEEDRTAASEVPCSGSDTIIHPVGSNDSFAGVALRYGVSIAALRRANQLWPSDPIHLRTELFIPHGDTLRASNKPTRSPSTDTAIRSTVEPSLNLSPDFVASSFVAARNMIISVLPARISMESLSSKASASEDHELDDFQKARAHKDTGHRDSFR
ncbi:hypothetical protein J3R82DRAFT_11088 [Butyriboletus roseoflavus]|nr:hypothetical protein J3R82DRAFT_11088 [Butyriboletus roseoflavus]